MSRQSLADDLTPLFIALLYTLWVMLTLALLLSPLLKV
jgi:hypothetical protein